MKNIFNRYGKYVAISSLVFGFAVFGHATMTHDEIQNELQEEMAAGSERFEERTESDRGLERNQEQFTFESRREEQNRAEWSREESWRESR